MPIRKRDPISDPRAALGEVLRQLRLDCELTQAEVAARIDGYGEDSVQKAESGYQAPVDDLYGALLKVYRVTPREKGMLDVLRASARSSPLRVPAFFERYVANELMATRLRLWGLELIPGPLQTEEYARAIYLLTGYDEEGAAEQAALRYKRHAKVDGPDPARVFALIRSSVLDLEVGGPQVMIGQLRHLLELSERAT